MGPSRSTAKYGTFAIAFTYVGTVVGAGFASGQEILQFFTAFGSLGVVGLGLTFVLFSVFGARLLYVGGALGAQSYRPLVLHAAGLRLGPVIDSMLTIFLLGTTAAMASGAGAALFEQYAWPHWAGSVLLISAAVATVLGGIRGVVRSIGFVAPILIGTVLLISFSIIKATGVSGLIPAGSVPGTVTGIPWYLSPFLYVSYNLLLAAPVLAPVGNAAGGERAVLWGGLIGGAALAAGAVAIHLALVTALPGAAAVDIPILYAARRLPVWVNQAYTLLLFAEIYTTAVATLFGFASRVGESDNRIFIIAAVGAGVISLIIGQFRFAAIVGTLYPIIGLAGLVLLIGLLRRPYP